MCRSSTDRSRARVVPAVGASYTHHASRVVAVHARYTHDGSLAGGLADGVMIPVSIGPFRPIDAVIGNEHSSPGSPGSDAAAACVAHAVAMKNASANSTERGRFMD